MNDFDALTTSDLDDLFEAEHVPADIASMLRPGDGPRRTRTPRGRGSRTTLRTTAIQASLRATRS
jgi:hypothetical protein